MTQTRTTSALIRNAIAAAQAAGMVVGAVRVSPGGQVEIIAANGQNVIASPKGGDSCDDIFGAKSA